VSRKCALVDNQDIERTGLGKVIGSGAARRPSAYYDYVELALGVDATDLLIPVGTLTPLWVLRSGTVTDLLVWSINSYRTQE
jgi:hypothetical protein